MGDIELRQPGYVAELIDVFNKAKKNENDGGGGRSSVMDGASTSWSVPTMTDETHNSRTADSLSEVTSSFSHDLPVLYSDYLQQSSSCQWSSPEGHSDTAEHCSIDAFATLRQSNKCVCICNQKNCEFLKKPHSPRSDRNTPDIASPKSNQLKKVFTLLKERKTFHESYELPKNKPNSKWWKRRRTLENSILNLDRPPTPVPFTPVPPDIGNDYFLPLSPVMRSNGGTNGSVPEIIEMKRMALQERNIASTARVANHVETNGTTPHTPDDVDGDSISQPLSDGSNRQSAKSNILSCLQYCKSCKYKPSPVRIAFLVIGTLLFLIGISYDFGVKHVVDHALADCWESLMEEYVNFGNSFMTYNEILLSTRKGDSERNYVIFNDEAVVVNKKSDYWKKVAEKDPNFIYTMEGLELSFQLHFFSILDSKPLNQVNVENMGPLYLKVSFSRNTGFIVEYIREKSNMSLSTQFKVYDLLKMLLKSNDLPYFGFHMKDYYDTTPTALLNVVVDALKKFKISASFLENLQTQTTAKLRKRRSKITGTVDGSLAKSYEDIIRSVFLPFPPDKRKSVSVPVPLLDKNLSLRYSNEVSVSNIPSWQFQYEKSIDRYLPKYVFGYNKWNSKRENKIISSMPYKNVDTSPLDSISRQYPMVVDVGPAIKESLGNVKLLGETMKSYPLWISTPHFNSYRKNNEKYEEPVAGFRSSESEHGSSIYFHPILGVPMNASLAMQIGIQPPAKMMHGGRLVPVLWARAQLERIPSALWYLFWFITHLRLMLITLLTCTGVLLMAMAVTCRCSRETPATMV